MTAYALRLQNSTDTAERVRKGDALGLTPGSVSGARNGLRSDGGGAVTAVPGTMTVEVTPFRAWVDGGASDAQGGYPFILDATATLTISDGDAVLSRTDTIVAEVRDDTYDASGFTDAAVKVITGTPGAGAPTLPDTCVALRDVTVPAGLSAGTGGLSSSNIGTDRRAYTAALGGIVPVSGATERDAMGAELGQPVYRLDTGNVQVFNGATWDTYKKDDGLLIQADVTSITTNGSGEATITFPEPFGDTPSVGANASTGGRGCTILTVTTTGFTVQVWHWSSGTSASTNNDIHWQAIGPAA